MEFLSSSKEDSQMKTNKTFITLLTAAFALAAAPVFAQKGLNIGGAVSSSTKVVSSGAATTAAQTGDSSAATKAGSATTTSTSVNTSTQAKTGSTTTSSTTSSTTVHGSEHHESENHGSSGVSIATRIDNNAALESKVQAMLPSGMSISSAAAGFKNEGQFLAALHVSQNLDIPFSALKAKMTGSEDMSLGAAIHALKPSLSKEEAKEDAKKAEREARANIEASEKAKASAKAHVDADRDHDGDRDDL